MRWMLGTLIMIAIAVAPAGAPAQGQERPQLHTNEAYLQEVMRPATLTITDPVNVFAFVLGSLPDRVTVYPTENYYYFRFTHGGIPYAGNIRFDPRHRDQGQVEFGYYEDLADWKGEGLEKFVILDASHDVRVERLDRLVYRVSFGQKVVVFAFNDVSDVKPPPSAIGTDERFLGPIFDESGIRFFLVYNSKLKIFHYILDETVKVADEFFPVSRMDRVLIGRRTGFAFYRDHRLDRKILIGVYEGNSRLNNYFDGPFDQLPENFIEGEALREAIVESDPSVKGRIDRLGHYVDGDGSSRYAIHPYMLYRKEGDLRVVHSCATGRSSSAAYYRCFVIDEDGKIARPSAVKTGPKTAR
jgi:hypothetical protein